MMHRRRVLQAMGLAPLALAMPSLVKPAEGRTDTYLEDTTLLGLALSWRSDGPIDEVVARVRVNVSGQWQPWVDVAADHGHGPDDTEGRRFSPPIINDEATAFDIEVLNDALTIDQHPIHDPVDEAARYSVSDMAKSVYNPIPGLVINPRTSWTSRNRVATASCPADSVLYGPGCRVEANLRHAVVHHTVNSNDYSQSSVPSLLRGIQSYHIDTRGWDDIGYNFIIDRFGGIWEARQGSAYDTIYGAHTKGFNNQSFGVSLLGDYSLVDVPGSTLTSLSTFLGWRLGIFGIDPLGSVNVASTGGDYAASGQVVRIRTVTGHRDNQQTSCPGSYMYSRLGAVRTAAAELVPIFGYARPGYRDDGRLRVDGWSIERFRPTSATNINFYLDDALHATVAANQPFSGLASSYPEAGNNHGFDVTVPTTIDSRSVKVRTSAADGRKAELLDVRLFAGFVDVESNRFYSEGVYWMRKNGITAGTRPGFFEPDLNVSRGQMASFIWRFMGSPNPTRAAGFTDVRSTDFYAKAIDWLVQRGVTTGVTSTRFVPNAEITRGEMAVFLHRLADKPNPSKQGGFSDVPRSAYYATAVDWMAQKGITTGISATRFAPDAKVTRGQMATFLFRLASTTTIRGR